MNFNVIDETSNLRSVIIGIAKNSGNIPKIKDFYDVGVRHIIVDLVGPYERRLEQVERFGSEVLPLLETLR